MKKKELINQLINVSCVGAGGRPAVLHELRPGVVRHLQAGGAQVQTEDGSPRSWQVQVGQILRCDIFYC